MTQTITIKQLQEHAAEILAGLSPDRDVVVEQGGRAIARIASMEAASSSDKPRVPGLWKGKIKTSDDFDAPLPDSFWLGQP